MWIFLAIVLLLYPKKVQFNSKARLGALLIVFIIYVGTCFIQLLTWADVGNFNLGVSTRYFIPLAALLPIIVPFKTDKLDWFTDKYVLVFIIGFLATLILAFATKYY